MTPILDDSQDDRRLVAIFLKRRDERTFRELYRRHTPVLYLLARRLLGGPGRGAEDAVQEAWLRAASRFGAFRWDSSLRTWLAGIAVRCCREAIRSRRTETLAETIESLDEPRGGASAPSQQPRSVERVDLERALARLPDGYREVLVLHDVEGYTHGEIATLLEIEEGTSKSQLSRARRQIRASLGGAGGIHDDTSR